MRGWIMAGLALALAACNREAPATFAIAHGPGPVERIECRQGECYWTQRQSVAVLGQSAEGIKLKVVGRAGNSVHGIDVDPPPPGIEVEWRPEAAYFFCSLKHPAMLWESDGEFLLDRLDVLSPPGVQVASVNEYMTACHNLGPGKWDGKTLAKLGYAKAASDQARYPTLEAGLKALGG